MNPIKWMVAPPSERARYRATHHHPGGSVSAATAAKLLLVLGGCGLLGLVYLQQVIL